MVLWLLIALPALAGGCLLVSGRRSDKAAAPLAIAAAAAMLGLAIATAVLRPSVEVGALEGIPAALAVDGLAAAAVLTVAAVFLAVVVFASADIGAGEARARFFGLMLLFVAAMLITVTSTGIFVLLASWEVMGAISYALIGYWWPDASKVRSATLAFITTRSADLGMYLAAGAALAGGAGGLRLAELAGMQGPWRDVALAGLALAALGKSAQLPFSFWLSHAMVGPSPVSALLHSATMVAAGGYLLLRIEPGLAATIWLGQVVAWVGALTALLLGAVAFAQRDLKQLLAASTCSQVGFIVLAAGVGSVSGGAAQFVAHAAVKSLLFLVAGAWLAALGTRDLAELRGVGRRYRVPGITFTIGALALGGIPLLSIWAAKDQILGAALQRSGPLYAVGLAAAVVSAAYAAKALAVVWGNPDQSSIDGQTAAGTVDGRRRRSVPVSGLLPLPVLAAAAVLLGVEALPSVGGWWEELLGQRVSPSPEPWELLLSGVLALAALAAVWWLQARRLATGDVDRTGSKADRVDATDGGAVLTGPGLLQNWLGLERAATVVITGPVMAFAVALARFDDRVLARGVGAAGALTLRSAHHINAVIEDGLTGSVGRISGAVRAMGRSARRPQTGLVHQYYAQAIVVLIVFAALFIVLR
ncbi:NADH-quinone oxidoreductase subunit L [Paenarthrobacter sp. Z7-10]|uniref:proton-conducting transporter transmembrane domain-containing protein n=1 Tax=Paenarthrobacter sp. Z7-10 TaxID=2787635 RepID=UPI0022A94060|nr:proton-conducting transporter membrane subunit [Paenarthrobacter sp. Z7-10]MCZ2402541.1 NADH-quinone oxidoreductase subunit L [Paenarthrobacter sp. Z7-10]